MAFAAPFTLSPEVIPYLFAALEQFEDDNSVAPMIVGSMEMLFPFGFKYDDEIDIEAISKKFDGFAHKLVRGSYYFEGRQSHPGELCKTLQTTTAHCRHKKIPFPASDIPRLLSTWSGKLCTVYPDMPVTDATLGSVLEYISTLAAMPWEYGAKYFYSHKLR